MILRLQILEKHVFMIYAVEFKLQTLKLLILKIRKTYFLFSEKKLISNKEIHAIITQNV
jgi:hypothetical protein